MTDVRCHVDPAWSTQLLEAAAPLLEELNVRSPREDHLFALAAMPRLRRLYVWSDVNYAFAGLVLRRLASLQWLKVYHLARDTLLSLLKACGPSLQHLHLYVGTSGDRGWPYGCEDLHTLLKQSRLRGLSRLQLVRGGLCHSDSDCTEQLLAVRRVLPGTIVQCNTCEKIKPETF